MQDRTKNRLIRRAYLTSLPRIEAPTKSRVNASGRTSTARDFSVDGSSYDGKTFPGPSAMNYAVGEDVGDSFRYTHRH